MEFIMMLIASMQRGLYHRYTYNHTAQYGTLKGYTYTLNNVELRPGGIIGGGDKELYHMELWSLFTRHMEYLGDNNRNYHYDDTERVLSLTIDASPIFRGILYDRDDA